MDSSLPKWISLHIVMTMIITGGLKHDKVPFRVHFYCFCLCLKIQSPPLNKSGPTKSSACSYCVVSDHLYIDSHNKNTVYLIALFFPNCWENIYSNRKSSSLKKHWRTWTWFEFYELLKLVIAICKKKKKSQSCSQYKHELCNRKSV